jgi:C-terminal processing protease CtpA/Prc
VRCWRPLAAVALLGLAIPGSARAQSSCSTLGQTTFVQDTLQSWYLWYRELPNPSPALFDSPEAYLEAVRYRPLDSSYSYIALRAASDAFFSDSQFIGIGITTKLIGQEFRVAEAYPDSPASEAGLERGARFLEIAGRTVEDYLARGDLGSAFGPSEIGFSVAVRFLDARGAERSATLTKRLVTIPTVSQTKVFEIDGKRVGYFHFRNFVTPSTQALSEAFAGLQAAGATELVVDERYNGGGLVSVAQHLGGLIGGTRTQGQVFSVFSHNDKNTNRNQTLRFEDKLQALNLSRLVVITTRASASASELVINALRPFMPVTIVGDATYGKPVGQYGFNFCDKVLYPVAFQLKNAAGQGDYFEGLPPDCPAGDDIDHFLGDASEASLAEALFFVKNGTCSAGSRSAETARALQAARRAPRAAGWQSLLNAY